MYDPIDIHSSSLLYQYQQKIQELQKENDMLKQENIKLQEHIEFLLIDNVRQ